MDCLAAALLGGQPLVSLLGDRQADSLSSGHGHPRLVALEIQQRLQMVSFPILVFKVKQFRIKYT